MTFSTGKGRAANLNILEKATFFRYEYSRFPGNSWFRQFKLSHEEINSVNGHFGILDTVPTQ